MNANASARAKCQSKRPARPKPGPFLKGIFQAQNRELVAKHGLAALDWPFEKRMLALMKFPKP